MKIKISELIKKRDELREYDRQLQEYDELKYWREMFGEMNVFPDIKGRLPIFINFPGHIKNIITSALDAEIKKMEEE